MVRGEGDGHEEGPDGGVQPNEAIAGGIALELDGTDGRQTPEAEGGGDENGVEADVDANIGDGVVHEAHDARRSSRGANDLDCFVDVRFSVSMVALLA